MRNKSKLIVVIIVLVLLIISFNAEYIVTKTKSNLVLSLIGDFSATTQEEKYPLLLLHGFNPVYSKRISEFMLKDMQNSIEQDLDYSNKGLITTSTACAELQDETKPIVVRASYLSIPLNIPAYSNNLATIINKIKWCTGAKKVDILSHSMGGIVTRYYLTHIDSNSVRKVVMLGTPNNGGLYNVGEIADSLVGESKINLDFVQLSENHHFMNRLNEKFVGGVELYTIAGDIDGKGDGLVLVSSVALGDNNNVVKCNHVALKHPSLCPEAYRFVKDIFS